MLDRAGALLRGELLERFRAGVDSPFEEAEFDRLALRIFSYQYERNAPYAAYCDRRGLTPATVAHWSDIPAVPTAAFKEVALVCGRPEDAEAVFRTSGTTRGPERRGTHYVLDLTLYHGALLPTFAAYLLPDGAELPILSLVPASAEVPDSSLSHMISVVMDRLGSPESGYFATAEGGLDIDRLDAALRAFQDVGTPVCLVGTSLAFVHWTEHLRSTGRHFDLPSGSRLMDTGGYKGAAQEWTAAEMLTRYRALLGVEPDACVNEYGMTELFSQAYDIALRRRVKASAAGVWPPGRPTDQETAGTQDAFAPRIKRAPPWVRTVAVDPDSLEPVPTGTVGLLRHLDLANLGSVSCVQTEDLGRVFDDGGFELIGRVAGAPPRGCSIAMDLLIEASRERRD